MAQIRNHIYIAVEDRGSRRLIRHAAKRIQHSNQVPLVTLPDEYAAARVTSCTTRIIHLIQKFRTEGASLVDTPSTADD